MSCYKQHTLQFLCTSSLQSMQFSNFVLMYVQLTGSTVGELIAVSNMHQRKAEMARQADAFIALPGSFYSLFSRIFTFNKFLCALPLVTRSDNKLFGDFWRLKLMSLFDSLCRRLWHTGRAC